jgi:coenzyme F420-0:L-glutamate ligase / coenzyme F420-1:gamma-L-glutamate ligase
VPASPPELTLTPIRGVPEVRPGDDLADVLWLAAARQGLTLAAGDVLVVAHKVVSKAEGRLVDLGTVVPSPFACQAAGELKKDPRLVEVILREARRIVRLDRGVLVVETHHGLVCANAGVDQSNVPGDGMVALLPRDPDASARALRKALEDRAGCRLGVIVADTFGRPWREGLVNVAVGVSGVPALRDHRGQQEPYGFMLVGTQMAVADEVASAAELAMGKVEGVPAVLVRGLRLPEGDGCAADLLRPPERDIFR